MFSIRQVDRVLQMEQNRTNQICSPDAYAEIQRGYAQKREDEEHQCERSYFLKERFTKNSVSSAYNVNGAKEPDKRSCK